MENFIDYTNHVDIVKNLNLYTTVRENQKPFEIKFEEIYEKAKNADLKLDTAKEFLGSLSRDELRVLQKFDGLADSINVDNVSAEGAYNLLVHDYEEYDFNNDGSVEVGIGKQLATIPQHMDDEAKRTWVKTMNAMGDDLTSVLTMSFSFHEELFIRRIAESLSQMSDAQLDKMQENATYDIREFINETLSRPYNPKIISVLDILEIVDKKLNPEGGAYTSPELMNSLEHLKEELLRAYEEVKEELKEEKLSTQKELEIKQELIDKTNEEKAQPLAMAIEKSKHESRTPQEIIAEYRAMPGQGGIAYEGMFEEQRDALK